MINTTIVYTMCLHMFILFIFICWMINLQIQLEILQPTKIKRPMPLGRLETLGGPTPPLRLAMFLGEILAISP